MRNLKKRVFYFSFLLLALFFILIKTIYQNNTKLNVICFNDTFKFKMRKNLNSNAKIQISYAHYLDTNDEPTIENFKFFMNFAHEPCHPDVDFTLIFNLDKTISIRSLFETKLFRDAFSGTKHLEKFIACQDERNSKRNTYVIVRKNKKGGDLCAFVDLIKSEFWIRYRSSYSFFFFINSSARGPFLPNYWNKKWQVYCF
jgi:hypothetical protein